MSWQDFIKDILNKHAPALREAKQFADGGAVEYAIVPDGMTVKSLKTIREENLTKPKRRQGTIIVADLPSFTAVTNRFKSAQSALFQTAEVGVNNLSASLQAVLNYHPEGDKNESADNGDHRVRYDFPLSDELKIWLEKNKAEMDQKAFAEFLEDNIADLVVPKYDAFKTRFGDDKPTFTSPSKIMELARGIDIRVDEKVTNAYRTSDGSFALQYTSENKSSDGKPLNIPEWFTLGIPVFENGQPYQIPVRLRFRQKNGMVSWFFELYRKNDIFREAIKDANKSAVEGTNLPIYNGRPESN